ncbi:hypothetical protein [Facklamia miroungae]|uniref:Uncharacterized protein n=1 Tax=Facklamia miroungae TaxID=120956 RepID=A0A1G7TTQ6_9LACT|nr:hypothetical protein [Facklamia miroungae]SDG37930.1 hypothetical protein SAMN05421791_10710 [Facklamia miroungae]
MWSIQKNESLALAQHFDDNRMFISEYSVFSKPDDEIFSQITCTLGYKKTKLFMSVMTGIAISKAHLEVVGMHFILLFLINLVLFNIRV